MFFAVFTKFSMTTVFDRHIFTAPASKSHAAQHRWAESEKFTPF